MYSEKAIKYFQKPQYAGEMHDADTVGQVGNIKCGDMMEMWILVKDNKIKKCKWKTFGCASAIASTSILSEMVTKKGGMKIKDAQKISPKDIIAELKGLPSIKFHCSVLGDRALREAIKDYEKKQK